MLTLVQHRPRTAKISWEEALRLCRSALMTAAAWRLPARQHESLAQLDDHLLADIGLTREARMVECSKPFWCL